MKKVVLFVMVVAVAVMVLKFTPLGKSAAVKAYEQFASAVVRGRYDQAMQVAEGDAVERYLNSRDNKPEHTLLMAQSLGAIRFGSIEVDGAEGGKRVRAEQSVTFNPPGVESGMATMASVFAHDATLTRTDAGWKVTAFRSKLLRTVDLRHGETIYEAK